VTMTWTPGSEQQWSMVAVPIKAIVFSITGNVFEDVNYGGGAGRTKAASSGVNCSGARVERFDGSGNFTTSTTTDSSGNYTFSGLDMGTYYIRVVSSSVPSSRTGYTTSCLPVLTYRTDPSSGTAADVTDYVGGHDPATADAGNAASGWVLNSSTGAFSGSGSGKAHAFAPVVISTANVTGVSFGWNFDTIVNTNDTGQGSLRQFITNANALSNTGLAQSGRTAGIENAIWMISNGTSASGLRSANNYFVSGVATIAPASAFPSLTDPVVIDAQTQPGWSAAPIVELNGSGNGGSALGVGINAAGCVVRGLVINRFYDGVYVYAGGSNSTIQGNYIGTNAAGTAGAANTHDGIYVAGANNTIGGSTAGAGNSIACNSQTGVVIDTGSATGNLISQNSIYSNAGLGIDLGANGVTANDGAKTSGQPNLLMDYPVFTSAILYSNTLTVTGYVGSAPKQSTFANARVEIFKSDNDASSHFSGQLTVSGLDVGDQLTATATDGSNNTSGFGANQVLAVTAARFISFTARGDGSSIRVTWETAQEVSNAGFHLYRATSVGGPFTRLTESLIPGSLSVMGKTYTYQDSGVSPWTLCYYQLEDVETSGKRTLHGPICVDWDGDGMADDWEIAYGLNPRVKDGGGDPDGDGVTNLMEYKRGIDPLNPDSDGDGIVDSSDLTRDRVEQGSSSFAGPGVRVIAADETGMSLELATEGVLSEKVQVGDTIYDRIRVPSYIHGYTHEVGKPELPVKGILVDLPEGASASLRVSQCDSRSYPGALVYPAPERVGDARGGMGQVSEVFALDQAAYATDAYYPGAVVALGETFTFRDQRKLQVLFYPLSFNPVARELLHYTKIRVRIDYGKPSLPKGALSKVLAAGMPEDFEPSGGVSGLGGRRLSGWSAPSADGAYRVLVADEGIYRLTSGWFAARGIDPSRINLGKVRLFNEGQEVAIAIRDGDGDNRLDAGDAIEFYGKAPSSSYSKYARYNVYWLTTSGGSGSPKRMAELDGTPAVGTIPATHSATVHSEENRWYWLGAPGDDSLERWFFYPFVDGSGIEGGGGEASFTLSLPGVSGSGTLVVRLGGVYDTEHEVALTVNGTPVGSITWSGISFHEEAIEGVLFAEGVNTVTLQCLSGTDSIAVDWFEATYPRAFEAEGDALTFTADGGSRFQVSGFSASDLELFDVTAPGAPRRITDFQVTGSGPYTVEFEPAETGDRTYLVLDSSALKTPAGITRDTPSTLASSSNGADYILITHRMLGWDEGGSPQPWLKRLVSLRQKQGLRVKAVDIQDVFDEFGYGIESPQAVKDFLAYAYAHWRRPAPRYVLLVGDSTYDPKGNWGWYLGDTTGTYLPTYLAFTPHMGETTTDEWFVRVSGDDLVPDLHIGRLPAATAAEAEVMVGKIVSYETAPNTRSWEKSVVLVSY
jgi:hypothetical protein